MLKRADDKKVHELRVKVKRLRALLRLTNRNKKISSLNNDLRKIGQTLSSVRDDTVRAKWLQRHGLRFERKSPKIPLHKMERKLSFAQREARRLARQRFEDLPSQRAALEKSARKMMKCRKKALKKGSDEAYHEWRKRVKDLLYQLEFFGVQQAQLKQLGHQLGLAHDCALAETYLREQMHQNKMVKTAKREKQYFLQSAAKIDVENLRHRPLI